MRMTEQNNVISETKSEAQGHCKLHSEPKRILSSHKHPVNLTTCSSALGHCNTEQSLLRTPASSVKVHGFES